MKEGLLTVLNILKVLNLCKSAKCANQGAHRAISHTILLSSPSLYACVFVCALLKRCSAYASIRRIRQHTSQHTSAYVSIRAPQTLHARTSRPRSSSLPNFLLIQYLIYNGTAESAFGQLAAHATLLLILIYYSLTLLYCRERAANILPKIYY